MSTIKSKILVASIATVLLPGVSAQRPVDPVSELTRFNLSAGYEYIKANAPPGGCQCFSLNGGYVSGDVQVNQWFGVEGQFTGSHANNISILNQGLTLLTYMGGPKITYHLGRLAVYGDGLVGRANGSDSYFPTGATYSTTASSLAYSGGGGVEYNLTPRFAVRIVQADYLHTGFPNGSTNSQSHLALGAGIVVKFRGRHADTAPVTPQVANRITNLACTVASASVEEGHVLEVNGNASTLRAQNAVAYSWVSSGGTIQGEGRKVTVDTRGVAPGDYTVIGRAVLDGGTESSDCQVAFHITAKPEPVVQQAQISPVVVQQQPAPPTEEVFHANVPDAFFDYDKWAIRPDTQAAILRAAQYLIAHPEIHVVVGGYSDERGTEEYNIALGLKRSNATRDALIADGVEGDRIQVISYGKGAQVCTTATEECWQQNRRAAFSLKP